MFARSRTVRIFLSSTFRDFAEERDLLVRNVFPELRRKCRARQVELVDVDLRWGITEEESQQGKVLPICLAEIDRSRPYFMGFIGERYGWIPQKDQYDLSLILEQPWLDEHRGGKSVTELEILHGVLNNPAMTGRAFFYFRSPAYSRKKGGPYLSKGAEEKAKLETLKDRIRKSGFPVVENYRSPEKLAERVREDLWKLIDESFPESETPDPFARERMRHEAYSATRRRLYLGGERYFEGLDAAMRAKPFRPVLISGQSGGGKSALLANWVAEWRRRHPKAVVIVHHLGCGADAADPVRMSTRLMEEIAKATGDEFKPESDPDMQLEQLAQWLAIASAWAERQKKEFLFVLDGLDKFSDRKHLAWFPRYLPPRIKLVASCLDGEILDAAKGRLVWRDLRVRPLTKSEQKHFISKYLGGYRKSLTAKQTSILQCHPLSGNPLFLLTVLEELRVFGVHERLQNRLESVISPPPGKAKGEQPTVDDVFEHVLARIEKDLGKRAVRSAMEAIWGSREGLYQDELLALGNLSPARWAAMQAALDDSLYENCGKINFGHDYLRKAVTDRYGLTGKNKLKIHRRLAEWFSGLRVDERTASELPWQWHKAEAAKQLLASLLDRSIFEHESTRSEYELLGYWLWTGHDIEAAYEKAWSHWRSNLSEQQEMQLATKLAGFLKTAGKYWKFPEGLYRDAADISVRTLGAEHPHTLRAMNDLGDLFLHRRDDGFSQAHAVFEKVYIARKNILGEAHSDTLRSAVNLGYMLHNFREFEKAEDLYTHVINNTQNPRETNISRIRIAALHGLGVTLNQTGRREGAERLYREALDLSKRMLGKDSMLYHTMCANLGSLLKNTQGMQLMFAGLFGKVRLAGHDHPTCTVYQQNFVIDYGAYNLAKCWLKAKQTERAKKVFTQYFVHDEDVKEKALKDKSFSGLYKWIASLPK